MQVVKNFLYNVSYQLLVIILPLITVPYVSNILGAEGIGDYAFTYANMQYFVIFGMVGITLYGNRQIAYVRENKENLKFYEICKRGIDIIGAGSGLLLLSPVIAIVACAVKFTSKGPIFK